MRKKKMIIAQFNYWVYIGHKAIKLRISSETKYPIKRLKEHKVIALYLHEPHYLLYRYEIFQCNL